MITLNQDQIMRCTIIAVVWLAIIHDDVLNRDAQLLAQIVARECLRKIGWRRAISRAIVLRTAFLAPNFDQIIQWLCRFKMTLSAFAAEHKPVTVTDQTFLVEFQNFVEWTIAQLLDCLEWIRRIGCCILHQFGEPYSFGMFWWIVCDGISGIWCWRMKPINQFCQFQTNINQT